MVVACDLAYLENGITVGGETKIACDRALELHARDRKDSIIVVTATRASKQWDRASMAQIMGEYMRSQDSSAQVIAKEAGTFNTSGEMKSLAQLAVRRGDISSIVIAVKWWHAPRSSALCRYWLWRYSVKGVQVSVSSCPSHASWKAIILEFVGAWPKNIFKMIMGRL